MKRIVLNLLSLMLILPCSVSAMDIVSIEPDKSVYENKDIAGDAEYLKAVAELFSDKYVVESLKTADITAVDEFYEAMSASTTIEELDEGTTKFEADVIGDAQFRKKISAFKLFGGLSGYYAHFEPICYYKIHRDIVLVGGYSVYSKTYENPMDAYWQCVCRIEDMTREKVSYDTRMQMVDKIKSIDDYINQDNRFKIFILQDGKINSLWERGDV